MSCVAAAVALTSPNAVQIIERAAAYARDAGEPCFVISVVATLPYGVTSDEDFTKVRSTLAAIEEEGAAPIVQEGDDVVGLLVGLGRAFGVRTLFVGGIGSTAARIARADPPFDIAIVAQRNAPAW